MLGSTTLLTTYVIRTLRICEAIPFCIFVCSISYCKFCSFQSLQKAIRCTKSVSNRAYYLGVSFRFIFDPTNILIKRISSYQSVPQNQKSVIFCTILSVSPSNCNISNMLLRYIYSSRSHVKIFFPSHNISDNIYKILYT